MNSDGGGPATEERVVPEDGRFPDGFVSEISLVLNEAQFSDGISPSEQEG
jgi:hypothetical protein